MRHTENAGQVREHTRSRCAIDSVATRAAKGDLAGPSPADRGKYSFADPLDNRADWSVPVRRHLSGEHARQPGPDPLVKGIPPVRRRGPDGASRESSTATRATTPTTCGNGYASVASSSASPARASRHPSARAGTVGSSSAPCPGSTGAAASIGATSTRPPTSSPSPASPAPSSAAADSPNEMTSQRSVRYMRAADILDMTYVACVEI